MSASPLRVLVAGGGVAALEAILALQALARDRVSIELLSPASEFIERPWSVIAPFTGLAAPHVSFRALLERGVRHHRGALAAVDAEAHEVITTDGGRLGYDRLIVAPGARRLEGVRGAVTFIGPISAGAVEGALRSARARALFVAPPGCSWTLPIYELALMAAHELADGPKIAVASFEPRPLDVFGQMASDALARLLHRAGIEFMPNVVPVEAADIALVTDDDRILGADAIISLPRLRGPAIEGLATDRHGFIDVDAHCRVPGVADVFAAGDVTSGRIKQGGLAAQQADAAAEMIAAEAGAPVSPRPCRRILRGVVLTGEEPLYLRRDLDDDTAVARPLRDVPRGVSRDGLWSPNGKIAGRYLSAFLASRGVEVTLADKRTGPDGPG
jgi:sulfide:quinone oxidoreductase